MIFVTVGTNEAPFDRLLRAIGALDPIEFVIQCGASSVRPQGATCVDFLPFDELVAHVRAARLVVCHAGVGSVMVSLMEGKRPLVVPRLARFREAVDDHQLHFARRFAERGLVTLVEEPAGLGAAIAASGETSVSLSNGESRLALDLRRYLEAAVSGRAA